MPDRLQDYKLLMVLLYHPNEAVLAAFLNSKISCLYNRRRSLLTLLVCIFFVLLGELLFGAQEIECEKIKQDYSRRVNVNG